MILNYFMATVMAFSLSIHASLADDIAAATLQPLAKKALKKHINQAIIDENRDDLRTCLRASKKNIELVTEASFHRAMKSGNAAIVSLLLDNGFNTHVVTRKQSLLHLAVSSKNPLSLLNLLRARVGRYDMIYGRVLYNSEQRSAKTGRTALGEALYAKDYDAVPLLINMGSNLLNALYSPKKREPILPADEQKTFFNRWFETHTVSDVRLFYARGDVSINHKNAVHEFFSYHARGALHLDLTNAWREYAEWQLRELLKGSKFMLY